MNKVKVENPSDSISPKDVELLLQWAGSKLLSLPNPKKRSYSYSWPDYRYDNIPNNFSGLSLRTPTPTSYEIDLLDSILDLIHYVPNPISRKIIQSRSLISPITQKHIFLWSQISRLLSLSPTTTKRYYSSGIVQIIKFADKEKIIYFKSQI